MNLAVQNNRSSYAVLLLFSNVRPNNRIGAMDTPAVLTQNEALSLVRKYKEIVAPRFDSDLEVRMFGSYAKGKANPWSDIDVAVIVPKVEKDKWLATSVGIGMDVDKVSLMIEPVLMERGEDSMLYREVMHTGIAV